MKKKFILIPASVILFFAFSRLNSQDTYQGRKVEYNLPTENTIATVTKGISAFDIHFTPSVGNSYIGFKEAVAFKESRGKYHIVNSLGYLGKYQFGRTTLKFFNIYDTKDFLNNPELQEKAFKALCERNKWRLEKEIKKNVGKKINGIEITESGILAAAHLAGAGSVKKYLRTNGRVIFADAYGSNVQYYMKRFAGYDMSFVQPIENPTI
ncbi:MAG: peptidoglycan-binding protein LysM [Flavobacteriaceae bacterium]|nr:peptidoglycan-binding protein LysM [Flavobacteriaceae bacterium]